MAHFYGRLRGSRGEATRMGTKGSGLNTIAASWSGCIEVHLYCDAKGVDRYTVQQSPWHGAGCYKIIATGIVGDPGYVIADA